MWRKSEYGNSRGALSSPDPAVQQPGIAVSSDSSTALAMWSQFIKIKGEISGRGDFFLDGAFEGQVHIPDGVFTVGPNARVTGEIEAREIIVRGEVAGTLKAYERVQILSTGKVTGDMDTRGIMVEEGAVLRGKVAIPLALLETIPPETEQAPQPPSQEPSRLAKGAAG
jgi:cytoskeletal protein CcmA (bactofilin family)